MFTLLHGSDIVPGYRTDHSGIILKIKLQEKNVEEDTGNSIIHY